ncbi:MAG: twin-arginine translocation pathway signal [Rhodobacteraceae bacterium]|uniref:ABC transporter substrate-binding protein n=1 Tax=Cypionkella sp. TaxID=2811411 RepID=UPI00132C94E6|nr:ABC transporter substrate-binding protein [Cypionkella sp.]KAF0172376.1 MAG: twin-arginine translocation pathway signal [Paracoccaceae bacterium]MDO8327538.1 ABC transporter substrate-binding protein [Cypionkella sp.]
MFHLNRRRFLLTSAATVAAASMVAPAFAADPILIGVPTAQSGPVGVADQADWLNGVTMAVEEINAAGGVNGRMLETRVVDIDLLTPEGTVAAFQSLTEQGVHALAHSFAIIPQPAMDVAAVTGTPYLHGNTSQASLDLFKSDPQKYRNIFQVDVAETWYGAGLVRYISDAKAAGWAPKNNRVHIVQEQIGYTQVISTATQDAIAASNGEWAVGAITDIQFPVQDWSPIIQALKEQDAGVIMIDHWVAAELASFANAYVLDPVPGALVYLQYGPSQPEFLDLAAENAEGFIWGSVIGTYADEKGAAFRAAYQAKYPGTMGMVYTGSGYDSVHILAQVWAIVDPGDFDAVGAAIKAIKYRGVCGTYTFANDSNSGTSYPNQTDDPEAGQAHLIFQVQDGAHKIIAPAAFAEAAFRPAPWM